MDHIFGTLSYYNTQPIRVKFSKDTPLELKVYPIRWCEGIWVIIIKDNNNGSYYLNT